MTLNVSVVCDGDSSSATTVMRNVARGSKHNLKIYQWIPEIREETDMVYIHYGGLLDCRDSGLKRLMQTRKEVKWIAGIRGYYNFKRWTNHWFAVEIDTWQPKAFVDFVYELDGVSVANLRFKEIARKIDPDLEVFVCHCAIDTEMFSPTSPPTEFSIGWAGAAGCGAKMFGNFTQLPFPKKIAAMDKGTYRPYKEMPQFYEGISVYVSTSVEEGCPLPPLEAAASGRPIVGIEAGCLPEWMPKEWLAPNYKGSYKLLIPKIEQLRDNRDLYLKECKRFRSLSLRFDLHEVAKEYDFMFESVMEG